MALDPAIVRQFEEMGPDTLRVRLGQYTGEVFRQAIEWLAQKDLEERSRNEATQAEQMRVALSANRAAWIAAFAAIIAAIAAIVTIVVEFAKK